MYVINSKRKQPCCRSRAGLGSPPTARSKTKNMKRYGTNIIFFCISKSKSEAAFRDKVSMSAVELSFLTFDSANIEFDFSIGVTVEKTFPVENKKPLKPL